MWRNKYEAPYKKGKIVMNAKEYETYMEEIESMGLVEILENKKSA